MIRKWMLPWGRTWKGNAGRHKKAGAWRGQVRNIVGKSGEGHDVEWKLREGNECGGWLLRRKRGIGRERSLLDAEGPEGLSLWTSAEKRHNKTASDQRRVS